MNPPITQTSEWQRLQHDLRELTIFKQTKDYQFLAIEKHARIADYLYLPYGPVVNPDDPERAFHEALAALTSLAKEKTATFIRIEPRNAKIAQILRNTAYFDAASTRLQIKKSQNLNPEESWLLDLTPDFDELYHNMKQSTRSRCKNYAKKGLSVTTSKDPANLKYLVKFQSALAKEKGISTFSEDYLKTELSQPFATLYLVTYNPENDQTLSEPPENPTKKIVAASLFFDDPPQDNPPQGDPSQSTPNNRTRYYMQSASDPDFYNNYPVFYALLIEAIKDAKEKGIKQFDFWGIAPDDAPKDHPWAGFTEFKKSFGGFPQHYAGTYDLILNPTRYKLYESLRKLHRRLKK